MPNNIRRGEGRKLSSQATIGLVTIGTSGAQPTAGLGSVHITHYQWKSVATKLESKAPGTAIQGGKTNSLAWIDHRETAVFDIIARSPDASGTPQADAEASFSLFPSQGMEVTITDTSDDQIAGTWYVDDVSKDATIEGFGIGTMTATKYGIGTMALLA